MDWWCSSSATLQAKSTEFKHTHTHTQVDLFLFFEPDLAMKPRLAFYLFFFVVVLRFDLRASHVLGKYSAT
jgi:hypothetical protein